MQFTSLPFLLFFPACAFGWFALGWLGRRLWPRHNDALRRAFLLGASLAFYLYGHVRYGVFLVLSILITYGCGLGLARCRTPAGKKWLLAGGALLNLSFLLFFKYYNFAAENVNALLAWLGRPAPLPVLALALPIGISFYTFQSLGYLVDVYRGQTAPERNIITYGLFVAFFPQVQSGPISRSTTLLPQLRGPAPPFESGRVKAGLVRMGWGLFKKLVIADRLYIFVQTVFGGHAELPGSVLWVGVLLFAVQMYCDFSGYTSMALGMAKILGYDLDENFARPYLSKTIPEFWRRWHISLGAWFKDYLFYPLLRSRPFMALMKNKKLPKGLARSLPTVLALAVVWLSTGLWHGAAWNYVAWGAYHGLLIILGTLLGGALKKAGARLRLPVKSRAFGAFATARTFFLVVVGFVFFNAASLPDAFAYLSGMFSGFGARALADGTLLGLGLNLPELVAALAATAVVAAVDVAGEKRDLLAWVTSRRVALQWGMYLAGLLAIVIFGAYGEGQVDKPFIYFQF